MEESYQRKIFSENLNKILSERNKSQKEVADAIGVSTQTFNTWVRGKALPRMGKLQALCDYLLINKSDLIDEDSKVDLSNYVPGTDILIKSFSELPEGRREHLLRYVELLLKEGGKDD